MTHQGSLSSVWNIKPCEFSIFDLFKKITLKILSDEWIKKMWDIYVCIYTHIQWNMYECCYCPCSASQFSPSVVSDSLWPHGLQYGRPPCPSPIPRVYSNSCPLMSRWCHPTISSSVVHFSSCLQSFRASRAFQMSLLFTSGGQSIGSFSFSISLSSEYSGLISFRMDWLDLLAVQGTLKSLLQQFLGTQLSL